MTDPPAAFSWQRAPVLRQPMIPSTDSLHGSFKDPSGILPAVTWRKPGGASHTSRHTPPFNPSNPPSFSPINLNYILLGGGEILGILFIVVEEEEEEEEEDNSSGAGRLVKQTDSVCF